MSSADAGIATITVRAEQEVQAHILTRLPTVWSSRWITKVAASATFVSFLTSTLRSRSRSAWPHLTESQPRKAEPSAAHFARCSGTTNFSYLSGAFMPQQVTQRSQGNYAQACTVRQHDLLKIGLRSDLDKMLLCFPPGHLPSGSAITSSRRVLFAKGSQVGVEGLAESLDFRLTWDRVLRHPTGGPIHSMRLGVVMPRS